MKLLHPSITRLVSAKTTTYVLQDDVAVIDAELIADLKRAAQSDPLKRARICLHRSPTDSLQQMIIAHHRDTYTHPHRHRSKAESFHLLEGRLAVILFNDAGSEERTIVLSELGTRDPSIYRLSTSLWHTVLPLTEYAVFHEITNGPFVSGDGDLAPWAPEETNIAGVRAYKQKLLELLHR
jgi:cupin fold WbuC family metalloprotein